MDGFLEVIPDNHLHLIFDEMAIMMCMFDIELDIT